ncbi:MAG: RidA family protein [Erythrobacter sp.]|uniref:RidA family protein n=1 Tax=Erythrobacter sp. TaxID=1042 RepID=UPI002623B1FC|nr:RidA family protein [Erythrobacter sp.]MDJ0978321.1 RidA family protein [Erythrobacter sp.]
MKVTPHNPTPWMQGFRLNHAVEVSGGERTLYLSGQTASDAEGAPLHPGDLVAQYKVAWANVVDALAAADMTPANLVRLNMYTIDVPAFMEVADQIMPIHAEAGAQIACTLLGVRELYHPDILIEIEGTASA